MSVQIVLVSCHQCSAVPTHIHVECRVIKRRLISHLFLVIFLCSIHLNFIWNKLLTLMNQWIYPIISTQLIIPSTLLYWFIQLAVDDATKKERTETSSRKFISILLATLFFSHESELNTKNIWRVILKRRRRNKTRSTTFQRISRDFSKLDFLNVPGKEREREGINHWNGDNKVQNRVIMGELNWSTPQQKSRI